MRGIVGRILGRKAPKAKPDAPEVADAGAEAVAPAADVAQAEAEVDAVTEPVVEDEGGEVVVVEVVADDAQAGAPVVKGVEATGQTKETHPEPGSAEMFAALRERFGAEFAAEAVEVGATFVEALELRLAAVTLKLEESEARLAAHVKMAGGLGEEEAASFDETSPEKTSQAKEVKAYQRRGLSEGMAEFAASIRIRRQGE